MELRPLASMFLAATAASALRLLKVLGECRQTSPAERVSFRTPATGDSPHVAVLLWDDVRHTVGRLLRSGLIPRRIWQGDEAKRLRGRIVAWLRFHALHCFVDRKEFVRAFVGAVSVVPGEARLDIHMRALPSLGNANSTCGLVAGARYTLVQVKFQPGNRVVVGLNHASLAA